ncbi:hypothetical protein [Bradyrhizobium paxllaeri]|uniref:hypothetical protein n=1 Tax=Bradyrhizobium paxllaeri TaxID=190148 RepID=UPI0008104B0C|nr:hypothetical protein [Bradyrhizobium paxllaeri]
MQPPFDFVHLDPSRDPPERYQTAFELFSELWQKLRAFRSSCGQDDVLIGLAGHLEQQMVIAGLVLAVQLDLLAARHPWR